MYRIFRVLLGKALIVWALVGLFVLPCAGQERKLTIPEKNIAAGYAVVGPLELKKVSTGQLVISEPPGQDPVVVNLGARAVSVMDQNETPLSMSAVTAGSTVIIAQTKDAVRIYVVPPVKKEIRDDK
jgi:hypothetical protein